MSRRRTGTPPNAITTGEPSPARRVEPVHRIHDVAATPLVRQGQYPAQRLAVLTSGFPTGLRGLPRTVRADRAWMPTPIVLTLLVRARASAERTPASALAVARKGSVRVHKQGSHAERVTVEPQASKVCGAVAIQPSGRNTALGHRAFVLARQSSARRPYDLTDSLLCEPEARPDRCQRLAGCVPPQHLGIL